MAEKSTEEKGTISDKQTEMILNLVSKRRREEESSSSEEIRKRQKETQLLSEEEKKKDEQVWEEVCKRQKELLYVKDDDEYKKKDEEIYQFLWNHQKQYLSEEEKEKRIKERQTYVELRQKETQLSEEEKKKDKQVWEEVWKRQKELRYVKDDEEYNKKDEEIYQFLWNHQKQYLSEEEKEKRIKERQTYVELRQKAIENPFSDVRFFPFGPGCVMPNFADKGDYPYGPGPVQPRPLTEEVKRRFPLGKVVNLPSFPPLPWDKRKFVPINHETLQKFVEQQQQLAPCTTVSTSSEMSREEKREQLAAAGRCLDGSYLTPYCKCDDASRSQHSVYQAPYPPEFAPVNLAYQRQIRQSHCFDIDDYPGSSFSASLMPLEPYRGFSGRAELLIELACRAILEYNEKVCNVFKYEIMKIEKVNILVTTNYQYWITVKVLNVTLGTPIETLQIHAGISAFNSDDKFIYCCRPKEEDIVGLPCCNFCFGKLH